MNKVVLAQIDTIAGDIDCNKDKIIKCIQKAQSINADLIIFPAFTLTGYPFGDILTRNKSIIERQKQALREIEAETANITALIGYAEPDRRFTAVIQNGRMRFNKRKILEINGVKYGLDLTDETMKQNPDAVIHCDCAPSRCGSGYDKNKKITDFIEKYGVNYIYVNKAGYADNFVFEGASGIYDKTGNLILLAKSFEEDFIVTDNLHGVINEIPQGSDEKFSIDDFKLNYKNDLERTYKSIVFAIKQYFSKNGFSKAVLGLSGGLDSSVCAVLLSDALGKENVYGISMPSKITSKESRNDAEILAKNLGIHFIQKPLEILESANSMLNSVYSKIDAEKFEKSTAFENLQARMRAVILWSVSNEFKGMLPAATSDKSEAYIGYATVNGDMSGGFAPIADVTKTKLFMLADYLNKNRLEKNAIPQSVLEKPPGAELKINPETGNPVYAEEDNMPYEFLDEIIHLIENKGFGKDELLKHGFLYEKNHKIAAELKAEWINKFFRKSKTAVYKWHIMPEGVITDAHSINGAEYACPVISKIYGTQTHS